MRVSCTVLALACAASLWPGAAGAQIVLGLADVLARAREQAPQIVVARLAVAEAQGRVTGASLRLQMNPELDFNVGSRESGGNRFHRAAVRHQPDVRTARATGCAHRRCRRTRGPGAVAVEEAARDVLRDAARLFYQALYAGERVRLLTASADLASSIFEVADRRFRAGDLAVLDVNLARSSLARARAEREAGEAEQAAALGGLRALLRLEAAYRGARPPRAGGEPIRTLLALIGRSSGPSFACSRPQSARPTPICRWRRRSRGRTTASGLQYQREGGDNIVFGGVTFALPVFSKGQELSAIGTARATRLRAELDAARARVRIELQTALSAYESRVAAARVLESDALPGLDESDALTMRSFDVGQIGLPDVLLIRREMLETRSQYLSAPTGGRAGSRRCRRCRRGAAMTLARMWPSSGCLGLAACGRGCRESAGGTPSLPRPGRRAGSCDAAHTEVSEVRIEEGMLRDLASRRRKVESRRGDEQVTLLGELAVDERTYAEVGAPVAARVVRLLAGVGETGRRGPRAARAAVASRSGARVPTTCTSVAQLTLAESALKRKRDLAAERIAPQREVQEAEAAAAAARELMCRAATATLSALGLPADRDGTDGRACPNVHLHAALARAGTVIERTRRCAARCSIPARRPFASATSRRCG